MTDFVIKLATEVAEDSKEEFGSRLTNASNDLNLGKAKTELKEDKSAEEEKKAIGAVKKSVDVGADIIQGILTGTADIIQKMYEKLKQSSPLLETIENLFNLAMTLLFMPLGNALGETFIPMATDLVANILSMWELFDQQFNNGDLGAMLTAIMTIGVGYIGDFIENIGESLEDQDGILGSIGHVLTKMGDFIENDMGTVMGALLTSVTFVADHLKEILSTLIAFKAASWTMSIAQLKATLANVKASGSVTPWSAAVTAASIVGVTSFLASEGVLTEVGLAEGGKIPATVGGRMITVAEGGEAEYIIPESKMNNISNITNSSVGGAQTITNNFYGYTQDELIKLVRETLRNELISSNYTSGIL